ncbi:hypothetical protein YYC_03333 [Plasmodium yoelii 17X]|uniref:Fam-b protein n=3 Tax=Plasmodium yoelii TaxID=5861 RepID=A0AAE9WJQ1_PLAYO|nr:fam-b protein [Plasmodium yoelii]ETB59041.1 hypothetical protein YYC_03333 [Plasmodium yoelii 17X]WBY55218.1 fam-b protein [Plasmodium yoelii yoelii]CDU16403.1 fam-b protein [Plasmodium yoelii]VTZ73146.1 fam-b protein [Plasmodium yoelii]|eukprot:XP_022811522.1 fam-b protein [Plasmodium yoelii]
MRVSILRFVFFSIIICFFEYAQNELYLVNERSIFLERNIIKFRSNRILADVDNQFDLNDFYESTLSLANQFNEYNADDKEMTFLRNAIDSHIKKHKESNTLPDLNNVDKKTKKTILKLQRELEEIKKELANKSNSELEIQSIHDKRIIKKDENNSVSGNEDFNQLENEVNSLEEEFKQFDLSGVDNYKYKRKEDKLYKGLKLRLILMFFFSFATMVSGCVNLPLAIISLAISFESFIKSFQYIKLLYVKYKIKQKSKTSK